MKHHKLPKFTVENMKKRQIDYPDHIYYLTPNPSPPLLLPMLSVVDIGILLIYHQLMAINQKHFNLLRCSWYHVHFTYILISKFIIFISKIYNHLIQLLMKELVNQGGNISLYKQFFPPFIHFVYANQSLIKVYCCNCCNYNTNRPKLSVKNSKMLDRLA